MFITYPLHGLLFQSMHVKVGLNSSKTLLLAPTIYGNEGPFVLSNLVSMGRFIDTLWNLQWPVLNCPPYGEMQLTLDRSAMDSQHLYYLVFAVGCRFVI